MLIPLFRLLICLAVTVSASFVEYWLFNRYLHFLLMCECIFLFPFSLPQFILIFLYCTVCPFLFLALQQFSCLLQWLAEAKKWESGEITKEEYDEWRYKYPELDTHQIWAKVYPQSLVLMAIVVIGIYLGFKREFSKLIGFLVVALVAVGLVFNASGVKDVLLQLFNKIIGA